MSPPRTEGVGEYTGKGNRNRIMSQRGESIFLVYQQSRALGGTTRDTGNNLRLDSQESKVGEVNINAALARSVAVLP